MTIFEKIMRGEIPCFKVYEDEHAFAFLDINPISRGHTLVVPREAAERVDGLSDAAAAGVGRALARVARAVVKATGCEAYNILQNNGAAAGQLVMHAHFHIIPRYEDGAGGVGGAVGGGLEYAWAASPIDNADAPDLARRIAARLV
ncbi:MAG: HIT family protein [Phycisphaerales bacterium]